MHSGRSKGEMIRCCLCANWFHEDCVGIKSEDDRGGCGGVEGGGCMAVPRMPTDWNAGDPLIGLRRGSDHTCQ